MTRPDRNALKVARPVWLIAERLLRSTTFGELRELLFYSHLTTLAFSFLSEQAVWTVSRLGPGAGRLECPGTDKAVSINVGSPFPPMCPLSLSLSLSRSLSQAENVSDTDIRQPNEVLAFVFIIFFIYLTFFFCCLVCACLPLAYN